MFHFIAIYGRISCVGLSWLCINFLGIFLEQEDSVLFLTSLSGTKQMVVTYFDRPEGWQGL